MNFRENLIQFRKAKYPSARKFAEELGIPYNTYLSYENPTKPTESRYKMPVKIATLSEVTTDKLLNYVNVDAAAKKLKNYTEQSSYFKVEISPDENGKMQYTISLKGLSVPQNIKSFYEGEFVETIHKLIDKAIEYTASEQQVLRNNINFILFFHISSQTI